MDRNHITKEQTIRALHLSDCTPRMIKQINKFSFALRDYSLCDLCLTNGQKRIV